MTKRKPGSNLPSGHFTGVPAAKRTPSAPEKSPAGERTTQYMMEDKTADQAPETVSDNLPEAPAAEPERTYAPEKLIPFRVSRKEALSACKKYYEDRWLLPAIFRDDTHREELQGGYVPFFLHSGVAEGRFVYDAQDSAPQDGPGKITKKIDNYTVTRQGTVRFERIPIIAPGLIPEEFMQRLEPFDFRGLKSIAESKEAAELGDYASLAIPDNREETERRVSELAAEVFRESVSHSFVQETEREVKILEDNVECVMLPIYILTTKFGKRNYHFAVNGQTGALYGDLPVHRWKLLSAFAGYFLLGGAGTVAVIELILRLFGKA